MKCWELQAVLSISCYVESAIMKQEKKSDLLKNYLNRHPHYPEFDVVPPVNTGLIVVIPVYREQAYLFHTLESLLKCHQPDKHVELILVFNSSEMDDSSIVNEQQKTAAQVRKDCFSRFPQWITPLIIEAYRLPRKHFGAGLARKIGLDAAIAHYAALNNPDGIIVTLDADTLVEANYFQQVLDWFANDKRNGASVYFEHPVEGDAFPAPIYEGIVKYELHLRYYLLALRFAGFPYAFHTMGSAMAFRALAYARIGGMPRKQAGEDFYFLQKLIPLGHYGEITGTAVFPSPRPSNRVLFGTGAAITRHAAGEDYVQTTYNLQAYIDLKQFLSLRDQLYVLSAHEYESWTYNLSGPMRSYLLNSGFFNDLDSMKKDCSGEKVFNRRFYEVFNAFRVVKYLNYVHEHFFSKTAVFDAVVLLLDQMGIDTGLMMTERELLEFVRTYERNNPVYLS